MNIRTTSSLRDVTYVTNANIRIISDLDKPAVSTAADYTKVNFETYRLAINTWLNMCLDMYQTKVAEYLYAHMLRYGLIQTIAETTKVADILRQEGADARTWLDKYWVESTDAGIFNFFSKLQICDYLRRFSIEKANLIDGKSKGDMLGKDRSTKFYLRFEGIRLPRFTGSPACDAVMHDTTFKTRYKRTTLGYTTEVSLQKVNVGNTQHWLPYIVEAAHELFPREATHNWYSDPHKHGPGAVSDSCTCLACKRLHDTDVLAGLFIRGTEPKRDYEVNPITVPKSYKTSRVISPMPTANQTEGYMLSDQMIHWTETHDIQIGSQSYKQTEIISLFPDNTEEVIDGRTSYRNPSHAALLDERSATVDMERASDTVTKDHVRVLVPYNFALALLANAPTYWSNGYKMQMFAPMGATTTFPVEMRIFAAVVIAAYRITLLFNPDLDGKLLKPIVFGDDIVCDYRVYQLVIELLENLGFIPNVAKSFGDPAHRYREACGKHFYNNVDVTCLYFPRHPMNNDYTSYDSFKGKWESRASSLLALNNHLLQLHQENKLHLTYMLAYIQHYIKDVWPEAIFLDPQDPWCTEDCLHGFEVKIPTVNILTGEKRDLIAEEIQSDPEWFALRVLGTVVGNARMVSRIRVNTGNKPCLHEDIDISMNDLVENLLYEDYLRFGPDRKSVV